MVNLQLNLFPKMILHVPLPSIPVIKDTSLLIANISIFLTLEKYLLSLLNTHIKENLSNFEHHRVPK
jgi:hypothetical protein